MLQLLTGCIIGFGFGVALTIILVLEKIKTYDLTYNGKNFMWVERG